MIIFYLDTKGVEEEIPLTKIGFQDNSRITQCKPNYLKLKSTCCHKYKKKGVNCKRCPLLQSIAI